MDQKLTVKEAAHYLNVHRSRVNQLCIRGKLKAQKWADVWQIEKGSVDEYRRTRKVGWPAGRPRRLPV